MAKRIGLLALLLVGCHGGGRTTTPIDVAALEEVPRDLLVGPDGSFLSVITHADAPYLFVRFAHGYEDAIAQGIEVPACAIEGTYGEACTTLEGCTGPVASVARVNGRYDAGLRYVPAPTPVSARVQSVDAARAIRDTRQRARARVARRGRDLALALAGRDRGDGLDRRGRRVARGLRDERAHR